MRLLQLLPLLAALAACRETPDPFANDDYGPRVDTGQIQLTYNAGTDHTPAWSENGDTVYYTATSFPGLPLVTGGVLLALPRTGGTVRIIMPSTQVNVPSTRWLTTPAITKDGSRIAYFDLSVFQLPRCNLITCPIANDTSFTQPELVGGRLHVRELNGVQPDVANVYIPFLGREGDDVFPAFGDIQLLTLHAFPFQRRFAEFRIPAFRPTWAPDGTQLVFSDGLGLVLWTPGSGTPRRIAGAEDGMWPAWSPDGQWIAYTYFARTDSTFQRCVCGDGKGFILQFQDRTIYSNGARAGTLVLIRPNGNDRRVLGEGEAPAWMPDGSAVIVRRGTSLQRIAIATGAAQELPGTRDGHAPAISPDGNNLAFARFKRGHDWDIWTVPLGGSR